MPHSNKMLKNDFDELAMSPRAVRRGERGANLMDMKWFVRRGEPLTMTNSAFFNTLQERKAADLVCSHHAKKSPVANPSYCAQKDMEIYKIKEIRMCGSPDLEPFFRHSCCVCSRSKPPFYVKAIIRCSPKRCLCCQTACRSPSKRKRRMTTRWL